MAITAQPGPNCSATYEVIVPHDTTNFTGGICRALYVGTAGNVVVVDQDGTTCLFTAVPAGTVLPVIAKRVNTTNTTASTIVALF